MRLGDLGLNAAHPLKRYHAQQNANMFAALSLNPPGHHRLPFSLWICHSQASGLTPFAELLLLTGLGLKMCTLRFEQTLALISHLKYEWDQSRYLFRSALCVCKKLYLHTQGDTSIYSAPIHVGMGLVLCRQRNRSWSLLYGGLQVVKYVKLFTIDFFIIIKLQNTVTFFWN